MSMPRYSEETQALQRALATEFAKDYCRKNGLSVNKLAQQRFSIISGSAYFLQPSNVIPNGLMNDRETMPTPTLVIHLENGHLKVEPTEHTTQYLGE